MYGLHFDKCRPCLAERIDVMSTMQDVTGKVKKKGKSAVHKIFFSRKPIMLLLLLAEVYILIVPVHDLGVYYPWLLIAFSVMSVITVIYIVNDRSNPSFKLPWCILITAAPVVGLVFYLFVRLNAGRRKLCREDSRMQHLTLKYAHTEEKVRRKVAEHSDFEEISHYLEHSAGNPTYMDSDVTYFPSGEAAWPVLIGELEKAEKFIFIEFFIIAEESEFWQSVLDVLERKAAAGVEVRLMYDGMCSLVLTPVNYPKRIREMGIACKEYEPIRPFLSTDQNNRDHRKIIVIDGKVSFTGGLNLSDEYVNITHPFGHWKDIGVLIKGPATRGFTKLFLEVWNLEEKAEETPAKYMENIDAGTYDDGGFVIPYGDGMPNGMNIAESVYLDMLNTAHKYVYISTPYLALTNEMLTALTFAARRGVDVKLLLPGIPDKKFVYLIARSYYPVLLEAGVKVYQYTPGFNHAKLFLSDGMRAVVGTVNMDFRSFYHHYECAAYLYGNKCIKDIELDFDATIKESRLMTMADYKKINILERAMGKIAKPFGCLV